MRVIYGRKYYIWNMIQVDTENGNSILIDDSYVSPLYE